MMSILCQGGHLPNGQVAHDKANERKADWRPHCKNFLLLSKLQAATSYKRTWIRSSHLGVRVGAGVGAGVGGVGAGVGARVLIRLLWVLLRLLPASSSPNVATELSWWLNNCLFAEGRPIAAIIWSSFFFRPGVLSMSISHLWVPCWILDPFRRSRDWRNYQACILFRWLVCRTR